MKFFKKINIGLILTIIIIIGVVIYCIHVESVRKAAKEDIQKSCDSFIDLTDAYSVLPSEYQVIGIKSTEVNLDDYYSKMQSDLEKQTISMGTASIQKTILTKVVESQLYNTSSIVINFDRQVAKVTSYQFSDNQVTVTFNSRISVKQKYSDYDEENGEQSEKVKENYYDIQGETITLEKVDGNWKVVYANLQYANPNSILNFYM